MHRAAAQGHLESLAALIAAGASFNVTNKVLSRLLITLVLSHSSINRH